MDETKEEKRKRQKREASNRYGAKHKEARRVRAAEWRKANPERVKQLSLASRERRKDRWQEFLAQERERYARDPAKKLAQIKARKVKDPTPFLEVLRRHYRNNKEAYRAKCAFRRAVKLQATPAWSDKAAIVALHREAARITIETGVKHEVDHIIPLIGRTICGLHIPQNMQILTRTENRRKHNRLVRTDYSG